MENNNSGQTTAATKKQIDYMHGLADKLKIELPKDAEKDPAFVQSFLKEHGAKVTNKQRHTAKSIAEQKGIELPEHCMTNTKVMRAFLTEHLPKKEAEKPAPAKASKAKAAPEKGGKRAANLSKRREASKGQEAGR